MIYSISVVAAIAVVVVLDLYVLRTGLVRRRVFWASYAVILFFQLVVNGVLTGFDIVRYNPDVLLGPRLFWAPIEDIGFGFALVTLTLCTWVWLGQRENAVRANAGAATAARRRSGTTTRRAKT
jgi:lycopene cyclase domain-containing protein